MVAILRYVNRDHSHRLYGQTGVLLIQGRGPGPKNRLVKMDANGELVVAPWGNWRPVKHKP